MGVTRMRWIGGHDFAEQLDFVSCGLRIPASGFNYLESGVFVITGGYVSLAMGIIRQPDKHVIIHQLNKLVSGESRELQAARTQTVEKWPHPSFLITV